MYMCVSMVKQKRIVLTIKYVLQEIYIKNETKMQKNTRNFGLHALVLVGYSRDDMTGILPARYEFMGCELE